MTHALQGGLILLLWFTLKDIVEKFLATDGKKANVYINHLLYGCQKIRDCVLRPFADEEHIGLVVNDEEIYITMDELSDIYVDGPEYVIKSNVMKLCIEIL